jgi:predicted MFS family arabinose efflux permease
VLVLVPGVAALVVEPVLFILADRYPRKWFVCGGLFAMAGAAFAAALAPSPWVLALATAIAWVGSGSGVALSQASLVDAHPQQRERVLARWALLGEIGDLGAPVLLAFLAASGLGWRAGYAIAGAAVLAWAVLLARQPFPTPTEDDEEEESAWAGAVAALRNGPLLLWLFAGALCELLDEIVIVFAALYLRDDLGVDAVGRSIIFGAGIGGAIAGAMITERLLARVAPLRLLLASSAACAVVYVAWWMAPSVWLSALLFAAVGATAAPLFPIASAQAYAALPGRSGTVNAAAHLFTPLTLAAPWALGALADAAGVRAALAVLLVQPVGLAVIALLAILRRARTSDAE